MSAGRTSGRTVWAMLLGGGLLALSTAGCSSHDANPMNDATNMGPAGNQSTAMGAMAAGATGNMPQGPGGSGSMAAAAGGSAGSSTAGSSPSAGAGAGPSSGSAGGDATEGGSAAGSNGNTAGTTAEPSDAGPGADDAGMTVPHEDLGKGDGRDVVLMGDSWMSNTLQLEGTGGGIAPSLQRASGQPYPNYGVQGVMLLSADAFGPAIPTQWDQAKDQAKIFGSKIKTVVMTGGGNDVIQNPGLQADCQMDGDQCKQFRMDLVAALDKLWTQMAADGVEDIIYVRYAAQAGMMMGSAMPMMPMVPAICTSGKVRCHALDTTALVNGEIALDNIHPLVSANDRMAKALVDMMTSEGMRR